MLELNYNFDFNGGSFVFHRDMKKIREREEELVSGYWEKKNENEEDNLVGGRIEVRKTAGRRNRNAPHGSWKYQSRQWGKRRRQFGIAPMVAPPAPSDGKDVEVVTSPSAVPRGVRERGLFSPSVLGIWRGRGAEKGVSYHDLAKRSKSERERLLEEEEHPPRQPAPAQKKENPLARKERELQILREARAKRRHPYLSVEVVI